ncbi:hypothetical protein G6L37_00575 [Agrobacterium rubi]|nr:hypothetical protein [Agrobacterium rubi]NTF23884.1 hypothetical protein [Agrobacterium rubi]
MAYLQAIWTERGKDDARANLANPRFEQAGDVHDWRNYVGKYVQQVWKTLDAEQRAAIALDADDRASREEWD